MLVATSARPSSAINLSALRLGVCGQPLQSRSANNLRSAPPCMCTAPQKAVAKGRPSFRHESNLQTSRRETFPDAGPVTAGRSCWDRTWDHDMIRTRADFVLPAGPVLNCVLQNRKVHAAHIEAREVHANAAIDRLGIRRVRQTRGLLALHLVHILNRKLVAAISITGMWTLPLSPHTFPWPTSWSSECRWSGGPG